MASLSDVPTAEITAFVRAQDRPFGRAGELVGDLEGWSAPVAFYEAPSGFGEESWTTEVPITTLSFQFSNAPIRCCFGKQSGRRAAGSAPTLQPRGALNHFACPAPVRFAQVFLRDALVDKVADALRPGASASSSLREDLTFVDDAELDRLCRKYIEAAHPDNRTSKLEMEARAILLLERLLGQHHGFKAVIKLAGALAQWQVARALEQIEASLDSGSPEPTLAALAAAAGLSAGHFCRAFAVSTGYPPHRFLIGRRVERARALLTDPHLSVAEVASRVGYDDPSYFSRLFRRHTGATPLAYRRDRQL